MSRFYSLAYTVGFTPWERAAEADRWTLPRLLAREEAERGGPGKALDLGCGSGLHTVTLAERGWAVTGVDVVPKALDRARRRVAEHRLDAVVVRADVTRLPETVGSGFDLFLDVGCFHGLTADERRAEGRAVTAVAAPEATVLLLAFRPGALPPPLPRGADRTDVEAAFGGWVVVEVEAVPTDGMATVVRHAAPSWYRLRRTG
jgi:SAM-dependent methyltransferase